MGYAPIAQRLEGCRRVPAPACTAPAEHMALQDPSLWAVPKLARPLDPPAVLLCGLLLSLVRVGTGSVWCCPAVHRRSVCKQRMRQESRIAPLVPRSCCQRCARRADGELVGILGWPCVSPYHVCETPEASGRPGEQRGVGEGSVPLAAAAGSQPSGPGSSGGALHSADHVPLTHEAAFWELY